MSRTRLAALYDQRDHLLASLEDLEREHSVGDLDDESYARLHTRYLARAAETLRAIEAAAAGEVHQPPSALHRFRRFLGRRRSRRVLVAGALCCLVALGITLAVSLGGQRLSGEQATGSLNLPPAATVRQDLDQAALLGTQGHLTQAIALYDAVLALQPNQPVAQTYKAWLERLAGIDAHSATTVKAADALLAYAAAHAPAYADAQGLYGLALYEDGASSARAVVSFERFLADKPNAALLDALAPKMVQAFHAARLPVPPLVARAAGARPSR